MLPVVVIAVKRIKFVLWQVAIATLDKEKPLLTITLLDGVSGHIIYRSSHQHSTGPIHLVHCENWVVVSDIHIAATILLTNLLYSILPGTRKHAERSWE